MLRAKTPDARRSWQRLGRACTFTSELGLYLCRIVQEVLNHIEKQAEAKTVQLYLAVQHDSLCLKIGGRWPRGFDAERRFPAKKVRGSTGLVNMRERAAYLGGTGEWVSVPNRGTTITVRVPRARNA